uniref:Uncharacterized protein n=1 Tax=Trichobilharzia regenti TaxID=157069 RepID=A0AA85ITV6_TRIRE|nr:unnamed protein product [Trichobilharzia regenti]
MKGGLKSVVALDRFCRVLEELSNKENLLGKRVFLCRWSRVDTFSLMMGMVSILLIAISAASYIKFSSYSWISFVGDTIFVLCSNFVFFITIFINRKRVYSFRKRYKILLNSTVGYIRSLDPETLSYCSNISGNQIVGLDAHITIRDAKLVVLPAILLVPGDVIVIKPGQTIFAFCKQLNSNENSRVFIPGDIFVPRKLNCNLSPTITASVEESDKPMMAIVTRSPLTSYLEIALSSNKKKKCTPQPLSCKVLHSAVAVSVIINITITFSLLISTFIIFCLHDIREPGFRIIMWFIRTLGVLTTSSSSFFFCLIWMIAISISTLRFQHVLSNFQNLLQSFDSDELSCVYSVDQPKVSCISHQNSSSSSSVIASLRSFCSMFCLQTFVDLENILLTLGTLSSVCCVNQEGVISQPLPTPEKVFFFHRRHHHHHFQENFSTYKSQTPISKRNLTEQGYSCQQCSRSDQLNTSTFPRTTKHNRIHLGHCFSAVFSNMNTENSYQLLSQGTGDILVSLCSDIWDGRDIVPLSESERELILGFHNRHLSSAYCIGFAYSPLVDKASESYKSLLNNLSDSKDILMLRLPGSENISPLLQRSPATCTNFDNINRGLLPLSHDVGSNEDNHNGVTPSEISIKFQNKKKSSQRDVNSHPKVINKMRKASLYSNSNFKKLNTNQRRSQSIGDKYFTSFLSSRDISDNHEKIKLNPINMGINDSFDEYRTDSIANELPRTKCVPEGDVYCETIDANHEEKDDLYIDPKEVRSILDNQIFLGLISMQYQANPQVVKTIKQLHQACIRFVHFSRENELRSRVFAERLGLECGWNCHISLRSPESHSNYKSSYQTKERRSNRISIVTSDFVSSRKKSASARPLIRSSSLPSLSTSHSLSSTNKIISASDHNLRQSNDNKKNMCFKPTSTQPKFSQANATIQARELHSKIPHIDDTNNNSSRSLSFTDTPQFVMRKSDTKESLSDFCLSSSSSSTSTSSVSQSAVEQSDTSQDRTMSDLLTANKSRLPCGIESIRPHLENIDNVPLQVSLFTDCSPKAIGEMVKIMKEYGDTVCLVGSCYSLTNYALFLQSDVAIAVKPILPYSTCEFANHPMDCRKQAHASVNNLYHCLIFSCATPLSVGLLQLLLFIVGLPTRPLMISDIQMNSGQNELIWLPADPFRSYLLGSREIFNNLSRFDAYTNINLLNYNKNCDLEPLFSIGQLFWLLFVVIPALTLSLIDRRIERNQPLREPPIKRNKLFTKKRCVRFALVTCSRFIPSVLICLFCEVGHFLWTQQFNDCQTSFQSIYANRSDTRNVFIMNSSTSNNQISVSSMYDVQTSCLSNLSLLIYSVKDLIFYQFITYLVIISFSYANYGQRLWQFRYCTNPSWCIVSSLIFISHTLYVIIRFCILTSSSKLTSWQVLSPAVLAFGFNWGILLVFINEFVSWKESKAIFTEHRLSRLYFNTKLGMYSPV